MSSRKRKHEKRDSFVEQQSSAKAPKNERTLTEDKKALYWSFKPRVMLGKGSFGEVEVRFHHSKGNLCATKIFKSHLDYDSEIQHVRRLNHDNVIQVLDTDEMDDVIHFKIASCTLEDLVEKNICNTLGLSELNVRLLIKDMLNAFEYIIDELKIAHRDIKPSNILFDENQCSFLVTDFGCAVKYDSTSLTFTDTIKGTPDYMHPTQLHLFYHLLSKKELIKEQTLSIQTEIWSIALCFFYAATGKHPFRSKSRYKWVELAKNKPDGSLCIDKNESYKYEIEGYSRLSDMFRTGIFQPLLVYMMSHDALFSELFNRAHRDKLMKDNIRLLNLTTFHITSIPCTVGLSKLRSTVKETYTSENVVVMNNTDFTTDDHIIKQSDISLIIPVIPNIHHQIDFDLKERTKTLFFKPLSRFFNDGACGRYNNKEARCVFANTFATIKAMSEYLTFYYKSAELYSKKITSLQNELRILNECLEHELHDLFQIKEPDKVFSNLITNYTATVTQALKQHVIFDCVTLLDIEKNRDVVTCKQYMDFLNHDKFSGIYKGHVLQIKSIVDSAVDSTIEIIEQTVKQFLDWLKTIDSTVSELHNLISKARFMHLEINKRIIAEIIHVKQLI